MELLAQTDPPISLAKPHRPLAPVGVALALIGLVVAVGGPAILEVKDTQPPDLPHVLAESAHKIKDHLAHKDIEVMARPLLSWSSVLAMGASVLGFFGAALGTASCARREKWRLSGIAIAFGFAAMAWNYFIVAAIAAVGLFLLAWVVSHFHR